MSKGPYVHPYLRRDQKMLDADHIQDLEARLEAMTLQHEAALVAAAKAREAASKLDTLCAEVAEIVERALKNKAIRDEWAWVFEDIHTVLTERNNPPDAIIEPHPATNKGDIRE